MNAINRAMNADFPAMQKDSGVPITWNAPGGTVEFSAIFEAVTPNDTDYSPERDEEDVQYMRCLQSETTDPDGSRLTAGDIVMDSEGNTLRVLKRRPIYGTPLVRYLVKA